MRARSSALAASSSRSWTPSRGTRALEFTLRVAKSALARSLGVGDHRLGFAFACSRARSRISAASCSAVCDFALRARPAPPWLRRDGVRLQRDLSALFLSCAASTAGWMYLNHTHTITAMKEHRREDIAPLCDLFVIHHSVSEIVCCDHQFGELLRRARALACARSRSSLTVKRSCAASSCCNLATIRGRDLRRLFDAAARDREPSTPPPRGAPPRGRTRPARAGLWPALDMRRSPTCHAVDVLAALTDRCADGAQKDHDSTARRRSRS